MENQVPKVLWNLQTMEMLDLSHNEQVINLPDQRSEMLEVEVLGTAMQEERLGRFKVGRAAMRGRRFNMEDALVVRPRYRGRLEEDFYAVFDGIIQTNVQLCCLCANPSQRTRRE